jgi:hypothetical protein
MRITQKTVGHLAAEVERLSGRAPVTVISRPGDGRTRYVMSESLTSVYCGARQACAYLLGILAGLDPDGPVHHVDARQQWVADVDAAYAYGRIPVAERTARANGRRYGEYLRTYVMR